MIRVMQWHTSRRSVLRVEELHMLAVKIDVVPVEPERFTYSCASVQHEDNQRLQVRRTQDKPVGLSYVIHRSLAVLLGRSILNSLHHPRLSACRKTADIGVYTCRVVVDAA